MPRSFPERPSLERYKREAKSLLKACREGDAEALTRVRAHVKSGASGDPEVSLSEAQLAIAREHGLSSWPRFLPGPSFSKIDVAGVVHDALFRWGRIGESKDSRKVGYVEANQIWFKVARAGGHDDARASWLGAWVGRIGLWVGGYPTWRRYRKADG